MPTPPSRLPFQPTSWSLLERAGSRDEARRREALETLAASYWKPVYSFLRRQGRTRDQATEAVQDFFLYLLERDLIERADPKRGRFRSYLLGILRKFMANQDRRARRPDDLTFSIEPAVLEDWLTADDATPERAFERQWALDVLGRALDALSVEVGPERWAVLREHLAPACAPPSYALSAQRLGIGEAAFTSALHRARGRLGDLVRAEVGEDVQELLDAL